jgi:hypothetical protein
MAIHEAYAVTQCAIALAFYRKERRNKPARSRSSTAEMGLFQQVLSEIITLY